MKTRNILYLLLLILVMYQPAHAENQHNPPPEGPSLSFEVIDNIYILTEVKINSESTPYRFMIDTGSSKTMVSRQVAKELGLNIVATDSATDGHSYQTFDVTRMNLEIEGLHFKNLETDISDYDLSANGQLCRVDGILGGNALKKWVWSFGENKLQVFKKIAPKELEGFQSFKMDLMFNTPTVVAGYHGIKSTTMIDLGYNGSFLVQEKNLEYLLGKKVKKGSGQLIHTLFNENQNVEAKVTLLPEFDFGDFKQVKKQKGILKLNHVVADVEDEAHFDVHSIGAGILEYYDMVLDYRKKKVYVKRVKSNTAEWGRETFGFHMSMDNQKVSFIWEDSPASQAGLQLGDQLLSINTLDLSSPIFKTLSNCEKHQRYRAEVQDQGEISITFRKQSGEELTTRLNRRELFAHVNAR